MDDQNTTCAECGWLRWLVALLALIIFTLLAAIIRPIEWLLWLAKHATLWSYRLAKSLRMLVETRDWVTPDVVEMITIEPTVWQIWPDVFRKRNAQVEARDL